MSSGGKRDNDNEKVSPDAKGKKKPVALVFAMVSLLRDFSEDYPFHGIAMEFCFQGLGVWCSATI